MSVLCENKAELLRKPAPWVIIISIMLGNGGIFCWYSYVSKVMTDVSGFAPEHLSGIMMCAGLGMVFGNFVSGKLADRYSPQAIAIATQGFAAFALLMIFFLAHYPFLSLIFMFICTSCLFALSAPQQLLIIRHSRGGEMLGASFAQAVLIWEMRWAPIWAASLSPKGWVTNIRLCPALSFPYPVLPCCTGFTITSAGTGRKRR